MGYKQPSSGLPFKQVGSSPAKQTETFMKKVGKRTMTKKMRPVDLAEAPTLGPKELPVNEGEPKRAVNHRS
jgi:hypothetical protein